MHNVIKRNRRRQLELYAGCTRPYQRQVLQDKLIKLPLPILHKSIPHGSLNVAASKSSPVRRLGDGGQSCHVLSFAHADEG